MPTTSVAQRRYRWLRIPPGVMSTLVFGAADELTPEPGHDALFQADLIGAAGAGS